MKTEVLSTNSQLHYTIRLNEEECDNWYTINEEVCKVIDDISFELMIKYKTSFVFRGVSFNSLDQIIRTRVDVTPSDAPIFTTDDPCKAIEYGWDDVDKRMVMMMFRGDCIKQSFTLIPSDTPEAEKKELQKTYPTIKHLVEESKIYLSKLALDDPRGNGGYEFAYGGFIPGNPLETLIVVFYIGNITDEMAHEVKLIINND